MNELNDLTPEELEAILGTDYETVIADALRRKQGSEVDPSPGRNAGQMGNGHVAFDPGYAIEKYTNRYRQDKQGQAAQGDLDKALAGQTAGRKTYAQALLGGGAKPPTPMQPPRTADSTIPGAAPPPPAAGASPMGAPPPPNPLATAQTMSPEALQAAGVPPEVLAELLRKRGAV